jgi:hypothetical protein
MQENGAGAATVGGYLARLLEELWREGEAFSGKRPFGDSSWEWELYEALVRGHYVNGTLDSDGYLDDVDTERARKMIFQAIRLLVPTSE